MLEKTLFMSSSIETLPILISLQEKAKEVAEKITQIRQQASEEFENVMLSSHAGEVFASN